MNPPAYRYALWERCYSALRWAREAGSVLLHHFRTADLDIHTKFNEADIVTRADRASEALLTGHIHRAYPTDAILSEESGTSPGDSGWRWVIDPLDGTTNFSAGLPLFSVSIGIEHCGVTMAGVVYAPRLGEMFHAVRGAGARLNGVPVHASATSRLSRAVVATGFPVDKDTNPDNNLDNLQRILPRVRGLRRLGSAAIDLSYVGAGFLDAYWELNLHPWDVSAGLLIAKEAGAEFTCFRTDRCESVIAGTPAIHDALLPLLSRCPPSPQQV